MLVLTYCKAYLALPVEPDTGRRLVVDSKAMPDAGKVFADVRKLTMTARQAWSEGGWPAREHGDQRADIKMRWMEEATEEGVF